MKVSIGPYPKKGKRRVSVKIDPSDTWSMDSTLALIIVPMLKQLKKTMHGIPNDFYPEGTKEKTAVKAWDTALDKMIWSFTQVNRDWEPQFYSGKSDIQWKPVKNGCSEMVHGPKHTFKVDYAGMKAYQARIQEGIDLFAKHYFSLWD